MIEKLSVYDQYSVFLTKPRRGGGEVRSRPGLGFSVHVREQCLSQKLESTVCTSFKR